MQGSDTFPILDELVFFNHAGVAPISGPAAQAIGDYARHASTRAYVGGDWYVRARQIKRLAAQMINARGEHEIAYIPNTSTGIALVARGLDWRPGDNVVITGVEYPANRYPWEDLSRLGVELIEVRQQADGSIDEEDVCEAITNRTRVVAISHVQYASGCRIDPRPIADMAHQAGGYLCLDAIQSVGVLPVDVQAMGVDFLAADGHKWMLGPEGCGFFYCHEHLIQQLHPAVVGWMNMVDAADFGNYLFRLQEDARRFEPGSYNIPGILALGASLELLLEVGLDEVWRRVEVLTERLCDGLSQKGYRVYSPRGELQRSGIVVFEPPKGHPPVREIQADLQKRGIVVVVREGRLRASPHFYNTTEQIEQLLAALP